ncbi:MAG: ABC transporter permease, partial [Lutibacter sp.]|nr:ABC transporter permease [Lutibacter sp.]
IFEVPVAVVNQDATKTSRDYIEMLNASAGIKTITSFTDLQAAKHAYYSKKVMGIVIVPKDFEKNIRNGKATTISTYADASNMVFYKKVLENVSITNGYFNAGIGIKKSMKQGNPITAAKQNQAPIQALSKSLFNTTSGYATVMIPILTGLIVQLVILMGIGILHGSRKEDKKIRTDFPRLLHLGGTIPVLLGKASLYTVIFSLIIPVQIGVVFTIFSIPVRSSLFTIYAFLVPYVFSVVFLGIAISSLFKRREESIVFLVLISVPSLMLSGLSYPLEGFSPFYQVLAKIIPSTPGIEGFVKLTQMHASLLEVTREWLHLWGLTLLYFILAAISLKIAAYNELKHHKNQHSISLNHRKK